MPETRSERAIFALGVVAIVALGFLVAHLWHNTHGVTTPAPPTSLAQPAPTTSLPRQNTTAPATTTSANTLPATTVTSAGRQVSLLLTAKSDTWVEVRAASSTGSVLFSGTLAPGTTKHFRGESFWARFGAAGNVFIRFGGKPLSLPSGTYDATFDRRGFRRAGA
jgi:Domain of unknown function (DUF4115)